MGIPSNYISTRVVEFPTPEDNRGNSPDSREFPLDSREFPESGLGWKTGRTAKNWSPSHGE